jgi:hypothetical protein
MLQNILEAAGMKAVLVDEPLGGGQRRLASA